MRIKICGLTREEDAALAESLGAWALGFIYFPGSKRCVDADAARAIIGKRTTPCVGVFVNQVDEAIARAKDTHLSGLQLHGDETPEDCARVQEVYAGFVAKALRLGNEADLENIAQYAEVVDYILLDTAKPGEWGGSGMPCDWSLAARACEMGAPIILAGGLGPGNIAEAAQAVPFFAADLSSGVETAPGLKDAEKMRALFGAST